MHRIAQRALWAALVAAAGVQAWLSRHSANPDGIGYLDASDQILGHGWSAPTNGYWSPLYPALLAAARWLFGAGPSLDYPLAHVVNFLLCLAAFACAEWLRRELVRGEDATDRAASLFCVAGAGWAAIRLIGLQIVSPDMGVLACVLGASAALLQWQRTGAPAAAAALGVMLGLGYLMKAVMFPIAVLFLLAAAIAAPRGARRWRHASLALLSFGIVTLPQLVAVSRLHGSPTFGRSGALNQAWHIGRVPGPLSEDHTRPAHISADSGISLVVDTATNPAPRLFFIDGRAPGTFPIWSDVTRWYPSSMTFSLDWDRQIYKIVNGVRLELSPLLKFLLVPLVAWLLLGRPQWFRRGNAPGWLLLALGVAPLGLYALVNVEFRLIAPFALLVILGLSRLLVRPVPFALLTGVALIGVVSALGNDVRSLPTLSPKRTQWKQLATTLREQGGMQPRLIALGDVWESPMYARLGRARVVAIVDGADAGRWWRAAPAERAAVESQIDAIPDAVVIARAPVGAPVPAGWTVVPGAGGYVVRRTAGDYGRSTPMQTAGALRR